MAVRIALRQPCFHTSKRCRPLLVQQLSSSSHYSSDFSNIQKEMISRRLPYITDFMTPTQTSSLRRTLHDVLPLSSEDRERLAYESAREAPLRPAHHLVYFPTVQATSSLLPDGTDHLHSPGPPFTRRMWAGGSMAFEKDILVNGFPFHCIESIKDVQVRGNEGKEKMFIKVERLLFAGRYPGELKHGKRKMQVHMGVRVREHRTLVFMRDNLSENSPAANESSSNVLKPIQTPDFSHTMVPTRELLFRFSALTFNAHAIHLDKSYCREIEGHRNLLVHGPLTAVLMVEILQSYLQNLANSDSSSSKRGPETIKYIEYKNLAPLYAEEQMKICIRRRGNAIGREGMTNWDVWIEGPDGGYAVKGTVRTSSNRPINRLAGFKPSRSVSGYETSLPERTVGEENIPKEDVEFQNKINATDGDEPSEEDTLQEDIPIEGKTEDEAKKDEIAP